METPPVLVYEVKDGLEKVGFRLQAVELASCLLQMTTDVSLQAIFTNVFKLKLLKSMEYVKTLFPQTYLPLFSHKKTCSS